MSIIKFKETQTPEIILPNQLLAQLKDNRLTIYWSDNQKIKTQAFRVNTNSDFYKALPKEGQSSIDANLIKKIRPKFSDPFTNDEIVALRNDNLGEIVKAHQNELPEAFLESEKERYYNLSRRTY